jgi:hypothetical protein
MLTKILTSAVVVIVLVLILAVVTAPGLMPDGAALDPGVTLRVQAADVTVSGAPWQMGNEAVARARTLALSGIAFLPGSRLGDYPADYTGLVGYVWKLPQTPELSDMNEWAHALRQNYAVEIPPQMLQPGDILANDRSGSYGHAIVFAQWSDPTLWNSAQALTDRAAVRAQFEQGVPFIGYEVDRFHAPAHVMQRRYTLKMLDGAMTIQELERELHGPYYALRSNQIVGYAELLAPVSMKYTTSGSTVTARFSIINRGGAAVTLNNVAVIAYGPDAFHQGLAGAPTSFPEIKTVILQPGQVYQYQQTFTFSQVGTYLAVPHFVSNGTAQMPAQPTYFQITAH